MGTTVAPTSSQALFFLQRSPATSHSKTKLVAEGSRRLRGAKERKKNAHQEATCVEFVFAMI